MRAVFDKAKVILDGEDAYLCIGIPYREAKQFVSQMQPKKYAAEIKLYREKRSLHANAYFWKLLDEMAHVLSTTKEELYLLFVKEMGPYKDFELSEDEAKTFCEAWSRLGTGWPTERVDFSPDGERVTVRAYYGSSTYNTRQMSRIIDAAVEEAKGMGIETLRPEEIARLKEEWR